MDIHSITTHLQTRFGDTAQFIPPDAWQVETEDYRLLIILSGDKHWIRVMVPILPAAIAQPYFSQILEANFDLTQEARYALHQEVLWGVFQYALQEMTDIRLDKVISQLLSMKKEGIDPFFNSLVEQQIRQIIRVAKQQGQSLEETMKSLDRFYSEGIMGDMTGAYQGQVLESWRRQLERFWSEEGA
jgi:hypothetical protein